MSRYAFDLDGTLDRPEIAQLANDLYAAGHEIHVVTGGHADTGEWTIEARKQKLAALNVNYTSIIRCFGATLDDIGREKARQLRALDAILMFDDAPIYVEHTSQICTTLFVVPRRDV